ncbi:MAG: hypothetical protein ACXW0Q_07370 [Methylovulum sp.]
MSHDFLECLNFSHKFEENPVWERVYREAFPGMVSMISYKSDGFWQREGIDRGIILNTTKQIFIDEKVRGRNKNGNVYNDIALEYLSSKEHNKPGWVCKPLRADYIAYLIAPLGICHLLPVIQLQNAWAKYGEQWIAAAKFQIVAQNKGYKTISVGVKPEVLYPAIGQELRVNFQPFEINALSAA